MPQRLKFLSNPRIGFAVFVSPHIDQPWGGMHGIIIRVLKNGVLIKFPGEVFEQFPQIALFQLEEYEE